MSWKPSKYECDGVRIIYAPRTPESVEYTLEQKTVDGKKVKVYREYSVFALSKDGQKKDFREKISTVDSRGFFINIVDAEGTIEPKTITLKRVQSWTKAKFEPVVAPKIN
ncbi:MAG: hypothetical protein HC846_00940 [Blastocatellia bacterium]|nr:hypothetical protein [Blastocatellia bacterium]